VDLVAAWLLYPVVALAVCGGLGLLVDRATGGRLPGVLVLPTGMAALLAVSQPTTYASWSAELTLPLVVVLTVAGLVLGRRRIAPRAADPWLVVALAGVGAVFAAPVVLSGAATFAGYTVLGDTSVHFIGADALLEHGREFAGLPPSSYEFSLDAYYGSNAYPAGGPVVAGLLTTLTGLDVAWTFQPLLTLLVVLMALGLWSLAEPLVPSRPLRALLVFVASQPALVLAYALQGSIKEIGIAFAVVLVAALVPVYARGAAAGPRAAIPLAVAASAAVAIVGLAAAVWLGPLLVGALVARAVARDHPPRAIAGEIAGFAVVAALLSFQSLLELTRYVEVTGTVVTTQAEFGNLIGPLDWLQMFGVWLTGDYRRPPTARGLTDVLIAVTAIAAVLGAVWAVRRRAWPQVLFVGVSVFAWWYVTERGSPWADAKALMIVSPAIVFCAGLGAAWVYSLGRRVPAYGLAGVLAFGVLLSNAWAYYEVSLAPRDRMTELRDLGERYAGCGPTLYTEFEEFAKHFLRDAAPEGTSEGWQRRYALSIERTPPRFGYASDPDQFSERYLRYYRTVVTRRGFAGSRPSSIFRHVEQTEHYDVWERRPDAPELVRHLGIGDVHHPTAEPRCRDVRALAREAEAIGGQLAYGEREPAVVAAPSGGPLPEEWFVDPGDATAIRPVGQGRLEIPVQVPRAGRYDVWVEGSFGRAVEVSVDGRRVGAIADALNNRGVAERAGSVQLEPGRHVVRLVRGGRSLSPGDGGVNRHIGPVGLTTVETSEVAVRTTDPGDWRTLCDRPLDWIEVLGRRGLDR
jgi:hypothetical protein